QQLGDPALDHRRAQHPRRAGRPLQGEALLHDVQDLIHHQPHASARPVVHDHLNPSPSRNRLSRFSPAWVSDSSLEKPRNPAVPLMVWMVRKMLASTRRSPGSFSRTTSSRSSRSRFSWLSTRSSPTISLVLSSSLMGGWKGASAAPPGHFMSAADTNLACVFAGAERWLDHPRYGTAVGAPGGPAPDSSAPGMVNQKVAPRPGSLSRPMRPPWAWAIPRAMNRPRPEPPCCSPPGTRKNFSIRPPWCSRAMP